MCLYSLTYSLYFRTKYTVDFGNKNHSFLDDRTNGRTYAAMLRPSVDMATSIAVALVYSHA